MLTGLQAARPQEVCAAIFTFSSLCLLLRAYWVKTAADYLRNLIYQSRLYVDMITAPGETVHNRIYWGSSFCEDCFFHSCFPHGHQDSAAIVGPSCVLRPLQSNLHPLVFIFGLSTLYTPQLLPFGISTVSIPQSPYLGLVPFFFQLYRL